MQIYTQFPNHARKNINFLSQRVNRSTGQRVFLGLKGLKGLLWVCYGSAWVCFGSAWVCLGLFWVCFGSVKKTHLFNPLNPIYT